MTPVAYINGRVLTQGRIEEDFAIIVNGGWIESVAPQEKLNAKIARTVDLRGNYLLPGFIDTQVNGGGGVLFNESADVSGIRAMAEAHWQFGTTGFLPTLISDDLDVIHKGVAAVDEAIEQGLPGVLGIHIEGPFLAHDRRGVHDARKLRRLTREIVDSLEPAKRGRSILTLAPDTVPPEMIRTLSEKGFIVCALGTVMPAMSRFSRPFGRGCVALHTCSMPCHSLPRVNRASSARRWMKKKPGVASLRTIITYRLLTLRTALSMQGSGETDAGDRRHAPGGVQPGENFRCWAKKSRYRTGFAGIQTARSQEPPWTWPAPFET